MSEKRINEELAAVEAALASLKPAASGVDRDRVMFLAGRIVGVSFMYTDPATSKNTMAMAYVLPPFRCLWRLPQAACCSCAERQRAKNRLSM